MEIVLISSWVTMYFSGLNSYSSLAIILLDSLVKCFLALDPFKRIHHLASDLI